MSQPSVAKAFTDTILPSLTAEGFSRDGAKRFRRVVGDLCQCVFLHVESRLRREFMIEYCTFLTVVPHVHYPLDHGGRFPVGSRGMWFRADTDERLARSITSISEHLPQLLDWFRHTSGIESYISTYQALQAVQPPALTTNGHYSFNLGCAYLLAGNSNEGFRLIEQARDEFEAIADRTPETRGWSLPCRDRCRDLCDRIQAQTHQALLDTWRQSTYSALKLPS